MNNSIIRKLFFLLELKAMLLGFALFTFIWMWVRDSRVDWTGSSHYHGYFANVIMSFPLMTAALCLFVNRWWSLPVAIFLSGRLINQLVFRILLSSSYAHDVPMFSSHAFNYWWFVVSEAQPQYLIQIMLGTAIFFYSTGLFIRWAYCRVARNGI